MPEKECACCAKKKHTPRDEKQKKDLTARIAKIQGQLKGIASMIEEDRYCGDVLIHVAAAEKALQSLGYVILHSHLESCVKDDVLAGKDGVMEETMELIKKLK